MSLTCRYDLRLADRARREHEEDVAERLRDAANTTELLLIFDAERRAEREYRERQARGKAW